MMAGATGLETRLPDSRDAGESSPGMESSDEGKPRQIFSATRTVRVAPGLRGVPELFREFGPPAATQLRRKTA